MPPTLPFKNPLLGTSFRWLLWSDALTLLAIMVGQVALPWWIAQSGGSHDLAVYGVLVSAMSMAALPLLSPFADRHAKRSLMAVGLTLLGVATVAMAVFASLSHYRLAIVVAIEGITVLATALIMPASNSIVTELVPPAGLSQALGLQQTAQASGRLVGPAICNFVGAVFMVPATAMLVPLKVQSLGLSAAWLGWCEASLSLGLLAGSLGPADWWSRAQGRFGARVGGSVMIGLALALAGSTSDRHVLVACFAIVGVGAATTTLVGKTHRMLARPLAYRARMSAAAIMTIQLSQTLGPALAGIALTHWSVRTVYVMFGLASAAAALGFFLIPGFRAFMALEHDEVDGFYARTYPRVFETI